MQKTISSTKRVGMSRLEIRSIPLLTPLATMMKFKARKSIVHRTGRTPSEARARKRLWYCPLSSPDSEPVIDSMKYSSVHPATTE